MLDFRVLDGGFQIAFYIAFVVLMGVGVLLIARSAAKWRRSARRSRKTMPAMVSARRVGRNGNRPGGRCSVIFQTENGDRVELSMPAREFDRLAEGERGLLTFQGRRCLSFERMEDEA